MTDFTVRGLPRAIAQDGWFLSDLADGPATPSPEAPQPKARSPRARLRVPLVAVAGLVALIALADLLFWDARAGLSLIVFSGALALALVAQDDTHMDRTALGALAGIWGLSVLPVLVDVNLASVSILIIGLMIMALRIASRRWRLSRLPSAMLRLSLRWPWISALASLALIRGVSTDVAPADVRRLSLSWALPIAVGFVFLMLISAANPIVEKAIDIANWQLPDIDGTRITFWIAIGLLILPALVIERWRAGVARAPLARPKTTRRFALVNAAALVNTLVVLNLMVGVQNTSDFAYLYAGLSLPDGMTFATYARRGAYALLAMSLLAGLLVLISARFARDHNLLRMLLILWIAQNGVLMISAILRLDLYIDAYGLTYLRLRAGLGMGLVAAGLMLLAWQILKDKSNGWMLTRLAVITGLTIYGGSFVNLAQVIAAVNLDRAVERSALYDEPRELIDITYLCNETPAGIRAIASHAMETGTYYCTDAIPCFEPDVTDWRSFTLRRWREAHARRAYEAEIASDTGMDGVSMPQTPVLYGD